MSASALDLPGFVQIIGRGFNREEELADDEATGPRVVLISEGLWRDRFGADAGILADLVELGAHPAQARAWKPRRDAMVEPQDRIGKPLRIQGPVHRMSSRDLSAGASLLRGRDYPR